MIEPFGEPYPEKRRAEDAALPRSERTKPHTRWRDLPAEERIRIKVQDTVRYYALTHGRILTAAKLGSYIQWKVRTVGPITEEQVQAALNDPVTIANLRALGVLPDDVLSWDEALEGRVHPDGAQMDVLDAIFERIDPADSRDLGAILAEHGVTLKTWNGWLTDPIFAGWVRQRTEQVFGQRAHEVDIALMRNAAGGDTASIKLILQLQGRLTDRTAIDTGAVLGRVLEILLEEIPDQAVLERIARRFEALAQQVTTGRVTLDPTKTVIPGELVLP